MAIKTIVVNHSVQTDGNWCANGLKLIEIVIISACEYFTCRFYLYYKL